MSESITDKLHDYIRKADLKGLKDYVDSMQSGLLSFDDPSLLMLAIEVYLDPLEVFNEEYQMEMILFLIKCGVKLWAPGGGVVLYIFNYCYDREVHTDEEFEQKLKELFERLFDEKQTHILKEDVPEKSYFQQLSEYLNRHRSAYRIQLCWKNYLNRKKLESTESGSKESDDNEYPINQFENQFL
jgi:hypothetical protein